MRQLNRQGRSALLWGLATFAALQALLAVGIEWRFPELRDPEFGRKVTRLSARTARSPRPYTIIMLGSSRVLFGFDARRLEEPLGRAAGRPAVVYNFGLTGAGPLAELLTLRRLLARGARPDLLLVEVLPALLSDRCDEQERFPALRLWRDDLSLLERYGAAGRLRADWWSALPVPWYEHRFAVLSRLLPQLLPDALRQDWAWGCDDGGWVRAAAVPTPEQRRAGEERARKEYADLLADFRPGEPACRALRELLDVCRRERIPATLVLLPESTTFRALYSPAARASTDAVLAGLGRDVPIIDGREWVADDDFWDPHHLRAPGAAAFTERLGRLLEGGPGRAHTSANTRSSASAGAGRSARGAEVPPPAPCQLPASGTQVLPP